MLKELNIQLNKLEKLKKVALLELKESQQVLVLLEKWLWTIQVIVFIIKAYIDLRKIENAKKISEVIASAKNTFLLDSNNLNLSLSASMAKKK